MTTAFKSLIAIALGSLVANAFTVVHLLNRIVAILEKK